MSKSPAIRLQRPGSDVADVPVRIRPGLVMCGGQWHPGATVRATDVRLALRAIGIDATTSLAASLAESLAYAINEGSGYLVPMRERVAIFRGDADSRARFSWSWGEVEDAIVEGETVAADVTVQYIPPCPDDWSEADWFHLQTRG